MADPLWPRRRWLLTLSAARPHLSPIVLNGRLPWQQPKRDVAGGR